MSENPAPIAYCGLYCGDCFSYRGTIPDMARDLRKELRKAKFARLADGLSREVSFFKVFEAYPACYEVLGAMVKMRCKKGCRDGGGNPYCAMRKCAQRKSIEGCWECDEFEDCEKLAFLEPMHGDEHLKNLRRIRRRGVPAFLESRT